ncbi:hypothetical protein ACFYPZ_16840 [Streptomyces sp. NPDC005506]
MYWVTGGPVRDAGASKSMNLLILATGGAGFIGSEYVCQQLDSDPKERAH